MLASVDENNNNIVPQPFELCQCVCLHAWPCYSVDRRSISLSLWREQGLDNDAN